MTPSVLFVSDDVTGAVSCLLAGR